MAERWRTVLVRFSALVIVSFLLLGISRLYSQVSGGTIEGIVTDPSGAVIPNATVTIRNEATNVINSTKTNEVGRYSVPSLLPGSYSVTVTAPGFRSESQTNATLTVGAVQAVNFSLSIGVQAQQVQVTTSASRVQTTSSDISGVVGTQRITQLPLNGRDWSQLATLQPGVAAIRGEQAVNNRIQQGSGQQMAIAGGRPWENDYRLDGISINDYANGAAGSALGVNLGVDAIQEFSVLTSNYPAQYGRSSGGIVNAITRSGTDQFHGDAYEFIRNNAVDARNYFNPGSLPPFKRNQFGGSAGGPIRKGHTFFFADVEAIRQNQSQTQISFVPTASARTGQLSTGAVTPDATVVKFINAFYPLPNGAISSNGDTGKFAFNAPFVEDETFETGKINQTLSSKDTLDGTFLHDGSDGTQPDEMNNKNSLFNVYRDIVTLEEDHVFSPNFVNTAHVGYVRVTAAEGLAVAINPATAQSAYGSIPGGDAPAVQVSGLVTFTGGIGALSHHEYWWDDVQFNDDAFWNRGNHSIKFGIYFENIRDNEFSVATPAGQFNFGSLAGFLQNQPIQYASVIAGAESERSVRENVFAGYLQDDWHARRNLVLNLGLRYEMGTVPTEEHGKLATLLHPDDPTEHLGSPFFTNPTKLNFDPRIGLAWDPGNNGKTAIRSGFGIFEVMPLPYLFELVTTFSSPYFEQGTTTNPPPGSFPTGAYSLVANNPTALRAGYVQQHPGLNYVEHWNLNVEHQFSNDLSAMVAYVGSHDVRAVQPSDDMDSTVPTLTSQGLIYPVIPKGTTPPRRNLNFGRISAVQWIGSGEFDALEARVTQNMTHGVQFQASYTWGKSIDTSSTSVGTDAFSNSLKNPQVFYPGINRGLSDYDVRQNLMLNMVWAIGGAFASGANGGVVGGLRKGWEVGNILQVSSGNPFNALLGGDPTGQHTSTTQDLPDRAVAAGCSGGLVNPGNAAHYIKTECLAFPNPSNRMGDIGRNALNGPGLLELDTSVDKTTAITERLKFQFRVEAFDIINHTNFAPPIDNQTVFSSSGSPVGGAGQIDSTQNPNREIQGAIKFIF